MLCLTVHKLDCVPSLTIKACFSYSANPMSYAPKLGKLRHNFFLLSLQQSSLLHFYPLLSQQYFTFTYTVFLSLLHPEVKYTLAADTENRKNNLKTRAAFINSSPGSSHESSGTITLDKKGVEQCIERQLALQVSKVSALSCDPS